MPNPIARLSAQDFLFRPGLVLSSLLLGACSGGSSEVEITEMRVASVPSRPAVPGADLEARFGGKPPAKPAQEMPSELPFEWAAPDGWEVREPSQFRLVNLRPAGDPQTECYVTLLPQTGGGLLANVNRWRSQVGQGPMTAQEAQALPTIDLLTKQAALVDLEGPFQGMTGDSIADARLVGAILAQPEFTLFLKMTGPRGVVDAEYANFEQFVGSLKLRPQTLADSDPHAGHDHAPGEGHDHEDHSGHDHPPGEHPADEGAGATTGKGGGFAWKIPAGWKTGRGSSMRLVTYVPGQGPNTECYVTVLGGDGGGLLSNVNRWRDQFGMSAVDTAEMMAMPTTKVLGQPSVLVDARGPYTAMSGQVSPDQALLGLVCIRQEGSVFVKMIGPPDEVAASRDGFLEFVESLEVAP